MNKAKQKKLEEKGFEVTTVADFLELTPDEQEIIELRLSLSRAIKKIREEKSLSQTVLAKKLKTSQSRLAKMESGDPSVSLDLLIINLFKLGYDRKKLSMLIAAQTN